jgi:hypothetical protein
MNRFSAHFRVATQPTPRFFVALFGTGDYMSKIDNCSPGMVKDRNRLYWGDFNPILVPASTARRAGSMVRFPGWANGRLESALRPYLYLTYFLRLWAATSAA